MQHTDLLLERDGELARLAAHLDDARAGRGGVVLLEGPPGIGKTRLSETARDRAREAGVTVLSARASELDRDFPFGVVRQLFEPLLAGAGPAARERLLRGAAGGAGAVLGPDAPAVAPGTDPSFAHFHALYWLLANLAEQEPAALFVDDLHWADASSLRFLQFVLPRLADLPVLLVLAARPAGTGAIDAIATDALTLVLRPGPLSDRAVAALVAARLGDADGDFCDACTAATGGNPFLVRELLRELAADDVAPTAANVGLVRQLAPPTVARAVLLRLARLGDDAVAFARAVAVLGDEVPLRRAAALIAMSDDRAGELAAELARADILAPGRPLAFAHPILRSAVYADMDAAQRGRAHRRAADLLAGEGGSVDALAVHLLATEPAGDAFVTRTLRDAAARALAHGAAATAVACLRRALAEPPGDEERGRLLLECADAELRAGDPASAATHFEAGLDLAADPRVRAECVQSHVLALQALGRHAEGYALLERVVAETQALDPELALSIEAHLIASASLERSRRSWALARLSQHRGDLDPATSGGRRLLATSTALDAFSPACATPAAELADAAERALAGGRLLDDGQTTSFFFAITVLVLADRLEPAQQMLDRTIDDARRGGSAPRLVFGAGWRSWVHARAGRLAEAEEDARTSAEPALSQGWFVMGPVILGYLIEILVDRGELEDAERLLQRSGMAERIAERSAAFDDVVHARARLRAARGDLDEARADLARLRRRRGRWNTYPTQVPAALAAPQVAPRADAGDAERLVREARSWGTPRALGMALHTAALAADGPRSLELLREAAAVLGDSPAPLEHARALTDLGAALRRANARSAAREPLRRALDLADACGARPLAERARQELRAAGGRPRRPRVSGVDALTVSERRVAAMAADGLSNPEIAQALFVTTKTVETHLSSAYRKLDIRSRSALPQVIHALD